MRPKTVLWISVAGLVLLAASLRFIGASRLWLVAVFFGAWFALLLGLALVGDRRYIRAFGRGDAPSESAPVGRGSLRIGWAIFIGEMVINVPVICLLIGLPLGVGKLLEWTTGFDTPHPSLAWVALGIVAFTSAWAWWSIVTPRWLLWAMRRVDHPQALRNAAIGSILWDDSKSGDRLNRTQWRTAAMRTEEHELLRRKVRKK